jgi:hypothetical protein
LKSPPGRGLTFAWNVGGFFDLGVGEVLLRRVKPILSLIVLLAWPCLGLGGRADASFALAASALEPRCCLGQPGFELQLALHHDTTENPVVSAAGSAGREEPTWPAPGPSHWDWFLLNYCFLALGDLPINGSSCAGFPSAGSSSVPGMTCILLSASAVPTAEGAGWLFLADERFKPPPFASRRFRPPRSTGVCA